MAKRRYLAFAVAAALVFANSVENALVSNAKAANTTEKTAPAGPTSVALVKLEKSAYEAWRSKDAKFWDAFLSDNFVGWGAPGRLDKASATKEYTGADCKIKSYALSEEHMSPLGKDEALLTHKVTVSGTCGGKEIPTDSWAAGVYVREGDKWKKVFHAEAPIIDPIAAAVNPVDQEDARAEVKAKPTNQDARTDGMFAVERAVWEAWRAHDAKKIADLTARDISFINIFGIHLATKADALKNWSGTGCEVKSVGVTDAAGTMLSPTVGILTFKATADGTCYGQKVGPVWGTSVYVKDGDHWKWSFGINLRAGREGA